MKISKIIYSLCAVGTVLSLSVYAQQGRQGGGDGRPNIGPGMMQTSRPIPMQQTSQARPDFRAGGDVGAPAMTQFSPGQVGGVDAFQGRGDVGAPGIGLQPGIGDFNMGPNVAANKFLFGGDSGFGGQTAGGFGLSAPARAAVMTQFGPADVNFGIGGQGPLDLSGQQKAAAYYLYNNGAQGGFLSDPARAAAMTQFGPADVNFGLGAQGSFDLSNLGPVEKAAVLNYLYSNRAPVVYSPQQAQGSY